ncbi:uncharacterized protein GGS25DRAFT_32639 [Hypoxylon fragiforme]|uniref:uncharacterized protein n=1 Tax=Hypoxylon fragiforme TaxID=63214 RepID=UPI0020C62E41|nr:uncharacterized protein GGS25DRAFT_32639 [Hypoxylon fragiforme]KAI2614070.1 hypothetical protein GGS25DRAFT_32639 [Hypoxylon fragiforme]
MLYSRLIKLAAATTFLAGGVAAQCNDSEGPDLLCYNESSGGVSQDVTEADIKYVASYLRSYGAQTKAGRQFTMTAADAPDCAEWTLYAHGTVLALGKHLDSSLNSSVLFSDIADTIDGGASATPEQQAAAIYGCSTDGGSRAVGYDPANPQYNTAAYLANGYTPKGILVKIVSSNAQLAAAVL